MLLKLLTFLTLFSCDISKTNQSEVEIIGGLPGGDLPYFAGLVARSGEGKAFCGGTFLTKFSVITAAHCVDTLAARDFVVKVGFDRNNPNKFSLLRVKDIIVHPNYSKETNENDIAIIKLDSRFPNPRPELYAQIPFDNDINFLTQRNIKILAVFGVGVDVEGGDQFGKDIMKVRIPLISNAQCQSLYANTGHKIFNSNICAGDVLDGNVDSCQGDSGGPAITWDENRRPILVGIVSWGIGCGRSQYPGVYTRVASFKNWIEANL